MQALIKQIRKAKRVALVTHVYPDGDALGSLLGLAHALTSQGIQVTPVLPAALPTVFSFLPQEGIALQATFPNASEIDLCIVLDASTANRTGFGIELLALSKLGKLAYVDHHPIGDLAKLSQVSLHSVEAAATTQLLYELISELGIKINPAIATCLLTGLYTDTGGFQYPNTTTQALDCASDLMRRGGKLKTIVQEVSHHKSIATLKLLGTALERLQLTLNDSCAVSLLVPKDFERSQAEREDVSGIIGELNVLPQARMVLLLTESITGTISGSLRTPDSRHTKVSLLAKLLGGGGHPRAAGFEISGTLALHNGQWKVEESAKNR